MHLEALADACDQGDGELTAQMLAELFQADDQLQSAIGITGLELRCPELKPERGEQSQDTAAIGVGEKPHATGIDGIERQANRHRFAVTDLPGAESFEFMGAPMAVVERPGRAHLERIPALT